MTTAETWARRVEEWQASGQTSVAFCEGREFTAGGLRHWAYRLRAQAAKASRIPPDQVKLARVVAVKEKAGRPKRAAEPVPGASGITVVVGAIRVGVDRGFDPSTLGKVLAVLRGDAA